MSQPPLKAFDTLFKAAQKKEGDDKKRVSNLDASNNNLMPPNQSIRDGKT